MAYNRPTGFCANLNKICSIGFALDLSPHNKNKNLNVYSIHTDKQLLKHYTYLNLNFVIGDLNYCYSMT